jgi:hypothetical protein
VIYHQHELARVIHAERLARGIAEREAEQIGRRASNRPIRRAIGRSMVRLGARLAADPNLRPVRSR